MTHQTVSFAFFEREYVRSEVLSSFTIRKDRPMLWLQRVCCYILRKLKVFDEKYDTKVVNKDIDAKTFMDRLFKERCSLQYFFMQEPDILLIGRENYCQLMAEDLPHMAFSFDTEYYKDRKVFGLKVHVIPWMRGHLVLPKGIL